MSLGNWTKRHPGASAFGAVGVICAVATFLSYPWIKSMLTPAPKPATLAYFYDTETEELVPGPVNALARISRPDKPGGEATCVRAYVMSCGDCAEASGRFVGYLMALNPEYKKALDAAPAATRARLAMPRPLMFGDEMFPALAGVSPAGLVKPGAGVPAKPAPKPVVFRDGEKLQIAEVLSVPKAKLKWRAPTKAETDKLLAGLKDRCGGKTPIACDPGEGG